MMKNMKNTIVALSAILIVLLATGCPMKQELTKSIVFELVRENGELDLEKIDETIDIIQKRLDYYGCQNTIERNDRANSYTLMLPEKVNLDAIERLISTPGKIEIWETRNLERKDFPTSEDSISHYITIPPYNVPFVLVHGRDTARVRRMLIDYGADKQWPGNIQYVWSQSPANERQDMYELYMIRSRHSPQSPIITNVHIEKASSDYRDNIAIIDVWLNKTGASRFEKGTRENIGKVLAIILDGEVYSAPMVNSEITGGRLQITGNFDKKEAENFSSILRYKSLPLEVKIK